MAQEWNANIHYDARLAACVPARAAPVRRLLFGRYLLTWTRKAGTPGC